MKEGSNSLKSAIFGWFQKPDVIARETFTAICAEKDARIQALTAQVEAKDALLAELVKPTPASELPAFVPTPKEPSVIAMAIRQVAQGDTRLMQYLHARKRELKAENPRMSDEAVAEILMTFETTEDIPESTN